MTTMLGGYDLSWRMFVVSRGTVGWLDPSRDES